MSFAFERLNFSMWEIKTGWWPGNTQGWDNEKQIIKLLNFSYFFSDCNDLY